MKRENVTDTREASKLSQTKHQNLQQITHKSFTDHSGQDIHFSAHGKLAL